LKEELLLEKYTRALFEVAEEQEAIEVVQAGMERIGKYFQQVPELVEYLTSPQIEWKQKLELAKTLIKGLSPLIVNFVNLVMEKERQFILPYVSEEFHRLMEMRAKRAEAVVTTAVPLPGEEKRLLEEKLTRIFTKQIVLENQVEPEIMGGLVVKIGHTVIDGSVKRQLEELGRALAAGG